MTTIKIFIASSSELSEERDEIVLILNTINKSFPDLKLDPIKWETDIPSGSYDKERIQDEINPLLDKSDIVILLIYSKLGKFTFEEYELARTKNKKIFIYFKTGFSPQNTKESENHLKVIEFKDKIVSENQLLFKEFDNIDQFKNVVKDDLPLYFSKLKPEKTQKPSKHLTTIPAYNQENLIGRKGLLETIHQKLATNKEVVLVNGVGGIGKTTIAYAYVNDDAYAKHYNHIAWVNVMDNIKDALVNQLSNDDTGFTYNPGEDVDANLKRLCDVMRHFDGSNLLVIDNANDPDDILNNKTAIEAFGWKTLFTSRAKPADTTIIPVEELGPEEAKELFCRFYKREIDEEVLTKLLAHIEHHTLLTELLAKAANRNKRLDIAALYDMIKKEGIKAARLEAKIPIGKHATQKDIEKEQKLYNYILAIFDLDDLNEDEKDYLRYFSILPPVTIDAKLLFILFRIKEENETTFYDTLDELVKKGWLQEIENSYKAHPLIQAVAREKLKPDASNCSILIEAFIIILSIQPGENPLDKKHFIPYAESILSFIDEDDKNLAVLVEKLAYQYLNLGTYSKTLEYSLRHVRICENRLKPNDPDLAASYNNLSLTYIRLGDFKKALEYGLKALDIKEKVLTKDMPSLATSYSNVSWAYQRVGDLKNALEYSLKAFDIRRKELPNDDPNLGTSYNNISLIYKDSGDLKKALEFGIKAVSIYKKTLTKDHPDLANSYNNISLIYKDSGDLKKALEYGLKAFDIRKKELPNDHSDLANSYNTLSLTYEELGDLKKALEFGIKAVSIYEKALTKDHPDLANSYVCIASTYCRLKAYEQAKVYIDKAVDIYQRVLPADDPNLKSVLGLQEEIKLKIED